MPVIVRKASLLADWFAAFCIMVFLCAAPAATAQAEEVGGGQGVAPAAKKKIALTQFDVANTQHVDDINNIYDGLPLALAGRLDASGEFMTAYTGRSIPAEGGEAQREAITRIAGESGAQFLISGVVVNAGTKQEKGYLWTSIGGYAKRHIEIELAVYDGLTGNRLLLRRLDEQAQGDVKVGNDKPFGSSIFLETEFGRALNRLLDLAVGDIRAILQNVPLSAHIVRVEARRVFLDAGSDSLLKPGDRLVAYVGDAPPVVGLNGSALGITERAVETITLTSVHAQFSVGELPEEAAKLGIRAGHVARNDPAEQRNLAARQAEALRIARIQQEALDEAEQMKAEKTAREEAARAEAEQAARAEADRIKAEKKAQAQARAQAAAEAKAARLKAAQESRARERAREKARAVAEARTARLKAAQEARAEAERIRKENEAKAKEQATDATAARPAVETGAAKAKAELEAASGVATAPARKKPVVPLKLKQITP